MPINYARPIIEVHVKQIDADGNIVSKKGDPNIDKIIKTTTYGDDELPHQTIDTFTNSLELLTTVSTDHAGTVIPEAPETPAIAEQLADEPPVLEEPIVPAYQETPIVETEPLAPAVYGETATEPQAFESTPDPELEHTEGQ